MKQAGLKLDVEVANAHVDRWLTEVANVRVHGTTSERPVDRLLVERDQLMPLPPQPVVALPARRGDVPIPAVTGCMMYRDTALSGLLIAVTSASAL